MWDYREFERVINGTPYMMYTNHGAEKFTLSESYNDRSDIYLFQFGRLFYLNTQTLDGGDQYADTWGFSDAEKIGPNIAPGKCRYCRKWTATLQVQSDNETKHLCEPCCEDIVTILTTCYTTTAPKMVDTHHFIYADSTQYFVAYHHGRDDDTWWRCDCSSDDKYHEQHAELCMISGYIPFLYRAAYAKWLCELVLDSVGCIADVKPLIIMYVLSGANNAWD